MISIKALRKLTGTNVTEVYFRESDKSWRFKTLVKRGDWESGSDRPLPNVYELMHKAKEIMIHEFHQCVWSGNGWRKLEGYECTVTSFYGGPDKIFEANTEVEAVFKAFEDFLK